MNEQDKDKLIKELQDRLNSINLYGDSDMLLADLEQRFKQLEDSRKLSIAQTSYILSLLEEIKELKEKLHET